MLSFDAIRIHIIMRTAKATRWGLQHFIRPSVPLAAARAMYYVNPSDPNGPVIAAPACRKDWAETRRFERHRPATCLLSLSVLPERQPPSPGRLSEEHLRWSRNWPCRVPGALDHHLVKSYVFCLLTEEEFGASRCS